MQHDIKPTIFYYNPNIFPREEYEIRKNESKRHAESLGLKWIDGDYDHAQWQQDVCGLEGEPERGKRCELCFTLRLTVAAQKAKELGLKPMARIIGMGSAGNDPRSMGLGPVVAVPKALENAGISMDDIQLIELNEAFAAQSIGCIKQLGWEDKMDIINVNGGAIALGHPVGSSGCRIIVTLVHEMKKRGLKYGLATLCIAGGMGQATVVEMCD